MSEGATAISAVLADSSGKLKSAAERFEAAAERTGRGRHANEHRRRGGRIADAARGLETANAALSAATEKLGELADRAAEPRRTGILDMFSTHGR